jgi:NAD(P)-dependent dehydrogenase (short-subunit alcohol dehydrogenase family)
MRGLKDKVGIVTGGASGIGAATGKRLVEEGAKVVVADRNGAAAEEQVAALKEIGGDAVAVAFDMSEPQSVEELGAKATEAFGRVDLLHNNAADTAAATLANDLDVLGTTEEFWHLSLDTNLLGYVRVAKAVLPGMLEREYGRIVNTSSANAFIGMPDALIAYSSAKAAIGAVTRLMASTYGKQGVRSNSVAPGVVLTPPQMEYWKDHDISTHPMLPLITTGRLGQPEDIAATVTFLLSADADWVNGQVWSVNGGAWPRE